MGRNRARWWILGIGTVVIMMIVGTFYLYHKSRKDPVTARQLNEPIPVKVLTVKKMEIPYVVGAAGSSKEITTQKIVAVIEGTVKAVNVDLGNIIKVHQILLEYDEMVLLSELKSAETRVNTASVRLNTASVRLNTAPVTLNKAQVRLNTAQVRLNTAPVTLNTASLILNNSKINLERMEELYKQKLIAKVELENAQKTYANGQLEYANAQLEYANAQSEYANAQSEYANAQSEYANAQLEYANAQSENDNAKYNLNRVKYNINYLQMKSPVTGVILERTVNPGETPPLRNPLFTVGIIDPIFMIAKVPEQNVGDVSIGQKVEVVFDAYPNLTYEGKIFKIDANVDIQTRTFLTYIEIPNRDLKLKPGLTGFSRISIKKEALALPNLAIINPTGQRATVFVIDHNNMAHLREIRIGTVTERYTEILSGLVEGEKVASVGMRGLRDKDQVKIMEKIF